MAPLYATIDGTQRELSAIPAVVGGVQRDLDFLFGTVDGTEREIFSAGYKWKRYSVSKEIVFDETGNQYLAMTAGDSIAYPQTDITDNVLVVSGSLIALHTTMNMSTYGSIKETAMKSAAEKTSNKWFIHNGSGSLCHQGEKAYYGNGTYTSNSIGYSRIAGLIDAKGDYIDTVESTDEYTYPDNGIHTDGYWYVKI